MHFTLKTNSLKRADLDEFVACYNPPNRHECTPAIGEEVRWRAFEYEDLLKRHKLNLDIF